MAGANHHWAVLAGGLWLWVVSIIFSSVHQVHAISTKASVSATGPLDKPQPPASDYDPGKVWKATFNGKFGVYGEVVASECDCREVKYMVKEKKYNNTQCNDVKDYYLTQIRFDKKAYQLPLLKKLMPRPFDFRMVNVVEQSFACVDGREPLDDRALRTPGGDFAEFAYLLSLYEKLFYGDLTQEVIDTYFYQYLQVMRKPFFYFHTDEDSVAALQRSLQVTNQMDKKDVLDLTRPPVDMQWELMQNVIRAEYQGNIHVKLMLYYPQHYNVSTKAVQGLIRSFFALLWNKDRAGAVIDDGKSKLIYLHTKLKLVVSQAAHQEGAWLNLEDPTVCTNGGFATVFPPIHDYSEVPIKVIGKHAVKKKTKPEDKSGGKGKKKKVYKHRQLFVYNPQAVKIFRLSLVMFFQEYMDAGIDFVKFYDTLQATAYRAVTLTKHYLTKDMPEYVVTTKVA